MSYRGSVSLRRHYPDQVKGSDKVCLSQKSTPDAMRFSNFVCIIKDARGFVKSRVSFAEAFFPIQELSKEKSFFPLARSGRA